MEINVAINHTVNYTGTKVSITGICSRLSRHRGAVDNGQKYMLSQFAEHYGQAKNAWIAGDYKTLSEFFAVCHSFLVRSNCLQ